MKELDKLNLSDNTIKSMIELVPEIKEMSSEEINNKEKLLQEVGCSNNIIRNIISSNPLYLGLADSDVKELFDYLKECGFSSLNILFDSNPYILNLEPFEIRDYINRRKDKGEDISDIVDDLESNPLLFNEM